MARVRAAYREGIPGAQATRVIQTVQFECMRCGFWRPSMPVPGFGHPLDPGSRCPRVVDRGPARVRKVGNRGLRAMLVLAFALAWWCAVPGPLSHAAERRLSDVPGYLAPEHIEGATTIDGEQAWTLFRAGIPFVDVRLTADYMAGRIPEARSLTIMPNPDDPDDVFRRDRLLEIAGGLDMPVVIYCNDRDCWRSEVAIHRALGWGFSRLYFFPGGFPEWIAAGYPYE